MSRLAEFPKSVATKLSFKCSTTAQSDSHHTNTKSAKLVVAAARKSYPQKQTAVLLGIEIIKRALKVYLI